MFNILVTASLRNRIFVLIAAAILVVYGALTLQRLPVDVFPDLNKPVITLMTEAEGLAPEEVELLVSYPIETAMNGMPGVTRVRPARATGLWTTIKLMWEVQRSRAALADLDPRMLRDIGLTEGQALREADRAPWDVAPRGCRRTAMVRKRLQ